MVKAEETLALYLNGNLIRTVDIAPGTGVSSPDGFRIILGQLTKVYNERQFAGLMDEFAIYDRALNSSEVLQIITKLPPALPPALTQALTQVPTPVLTRALIPASTRAPIPTFPSGT